ncbi:MAG TPA: hypothetical protein VFD46_12325 [Chryseolinea sp.]|nr:hypothetical protein [Chryseolinea sp.]
MSNQEQVVSFVPLFFIGLSAVVSIRALFTNAPPTLKMLARLCIITFCVEMIGHVTKDEIDNYWLYNIFHFFYYTYLAYIFYHQLNSERIKIFIAVFFVAFFAFAIYNTLFIQGLFSLQTYTMVIGGAFIFLLAGFYFWELIISEGESLTRDPFFWLSLGLIIYFGGTIPFLGMFNYLRENFYEFTVFYHRNISNAFSILLNILIVVAFLCKRSSPKLF